MLEKDYPPLYSFKVGETLQKPVMICDIADAKTKDNKPYVKMRLCDSTGSVVASMFQLPDGSVASKEEMSKRGFVKTSIVNAKLEKTKKDDRCYINITDIDHSTDPDVTLKDFAQLCDGNPKEKFDEIIGLLKEISEKKKFISADEKKTMCDLAIDLFFKYEDKIKWSAAAQMMHSEKAGGWLEHTLPMVKGAISMSKIYPDCNADLLVGGTALHDIGKIEELYTDELGIATYTPRGVAMGHIVIGAMMVHEYYLEHKDEYSEEDIMMLESMILSHHGELEYGSPIQPISFEAYILHYLDMMDATYQEMKKGLMKTKPGEISEEKPMGINHYIYKPKEV